ncbi:MAG: hypothetical protein RIQ56_837 [Candidatus Parcubacteria bacterium]|jgi:hypothetical protein
MTELDNQNNAPETVPQGLRVEIGPGNLEGHSLLELSPTELARAESGTPFLTISSRKKDLARLRHGATRKMTLDQFVKDPAFDGKVGRIHIGNVFSLLRNSDGAKSKTAARIEGLYRKLEPGGLALIVENNTPDASAYLRNFPFSQSGINAEVISDVGEYRSKLAELDIAESETAKWFAQTYAESGVPWRPFLVILRKPR